MYKIIRNFSEDWEQLLNPKGEVIAENHCLDVSEVLRALKIDFEEEEINDEPADIDDDCGFDPFMGEYTWDC